MIDRKALLDDLKRQVKAVETDLGKQVKALDDVNSRLRAEHKQAFKLGRTAATWNSWLDERITQVAAAWVLGTVFVRFCEDNGLIPEPYLAGPSVERQDVALERYRAYLDEDDDPTFRGWLEHAFDELGSGQAGKLLFDRRHNPLYQIPLSHDGARTLVEFWRERDENGVLVHDFTDPLSDDGTTGWDTRFLGDLYQDLSEAARKTYALLQTPEFVEEFILDRAMDPAVREFGYEELKMIDPTCGSGHFVLGAFRRLVRLWADRQPGRDVHERVRAALDSVHGVDINPFAIAIARFRLLVAAMAASGVHTLAEAGRYDWPIHLAVGDSLIKSRQLELTLIGEESGDPLAEFAYATEDVHEHPRILEEGRYHVVVGNPPYITVKDKKLNAVYRDLYSSCSREYALSVPFMERFFQLAARETPGSYNSGRVGQITANSFMKREFGSKLIEDYIPGRVDLKEVIDTSGAYIPGHGTPTVILIGTPSNRTHRSSTVRTVRSVEGEPTAPKDPANGFVWRDITEHIDRPGYNGRWVSVGDLEYDRYFSRHPWITTDGGMEIVEKLHQQSVRTLRDILALDVGSGGTTGDDNAYFLPDYSTAKRLGIENAITMVTGGVVRDYTVSAPGVAIWPYTESMAPAKPPAIPLTLRALWPNRRVLQRRKRFGKPVESIPGVSWYEYRELYPAKLDSEYRITFSEVSTHNNFALIRGSQAFSQTAPLLKLETDATAFEHARILALIGSSTACFWLKMQCHSKGGSGLGRGFQNEEWENRYQFNGANVEQLPLPPNLPSQLTQKFTENAQRLADVDPSTALDLDYPRDIANTLRRQKHAWSNSRGQMIALQEEIDWQVYSLYDLHSEDLQAPEPEMPGLVLGERAFEIVLARRVANGEASDEWFKRHGSTPITEIPSHWPESYKALVQKRIDAIESSRAMGMIERPEYKRRWTTEGWEALQERALRAWLLDRIEFRHLWFDENDNPTLRTRAQLTDDLARDEDFVSVAALYEPRQELPAVVADLLTDEHVPFLAALRYKPSGLKKRADWEHVWDLQRQEDAAPDEPAKRKIRDSIPVPPKYISADFLKPSYWRARGKLDLPKERFISYSPSISGTPDLFGWAGWDHREQAQALTTYFTNNSLTTEEITPFLAGLLELQPWLGQWHNEFDAMYGGSPADFFAGYRAQIQGEHNLTDTDLHTWRPTPTRRGRRPS